MTDWTADVETLSSNVHRYVVRRGAAVLSYAEVVGGWCDDEGFRSFHEELLIASEFHGFRWETPAVTSDTLDRPYEFVLIRADRLDRRVDSRSFAEHFGRASGSVTVFPSLRGDAQLVVPCPEANEIAYGHLAAFVRRAPAAQRDELLRTLGETLRARVGAKPIWTNTAAMGVAWLHVRLDSRPKYYHHSPYKAAP